eukprot:6180900-Pleurochrysis_carterae.AAC.1
MSSCCNCEEPRTPAARRLLRCPALLAAYGRHASALLRHLTCHPSEARRSCKAQLPRQRYSSSAFLPGTLVPTSAYPISVCKPTHILCKVRAGRPFCRREASDAETWHPPLRVSPQFRGARQGGQQDLRVLLLPQGLAGHAGTPLSPLERQQLARTYARSGVHPHSTCRSGWARSEGILGVLRRARVRPGHCLLSEGEGVDSLAPAR